MEANHMDVALHPLLLRQLRKLALNPTQVPGQQTWPLLLERVSRAYVEAEQDRYLMERSQEISSREMNALNDALQISQSRLASLVSLSSDVIWEQNADLRFTYFSEKLNNKSGLDPSVLLGWDCTDGNYCTSAPEALQDVRERMEKHQAFRDFVFGFRTSAGRQFYLSISGEPVFEEEKFSGYRGVGSDITQAILAEQKVMQMARYDGMTGLPNRNMLTDELGRALSRAKRNGTSFALFFIDLDRFKHVNDTLGHAAGDELLKVVATRLSDLLRETDLVSRLGGDEFVVLVESCADPEALGHLARSMMTSINEPLILQGHTMHIGCSIGISVYPVDSVDAPNLLKNADAAMYLAKSQGKNNYQFYTAKLAQQAENQFALETGLQHALDHDELVLHYQPKIHVKSGELAGVEALVRWQHPELGLLMPDEFIHLAEEIGLIIPLGRWVLRAVCRQLQAWREEGYSPPRCAINLSVRQFGNDALADEIVECLLEHDLESALLEVEITESLLMADPTRASRILEGLHRAGVRIAIDDFGTGYSSLAYLKKFPAQALKIDRSFISDLPNNREDIAITKAIIGMAHSLGLEVVAEGVETTEQLAFLSALGCDEVQGFLLGKGVPAEEFADRLEPAPHNQPFQPMISLVRSSS